jgi:hypothetical protein
MDSGSAPMVRRRGTKAGGLSLRAEAACDIFHNL